jgi:DNA-binding NtrC family response regulator
MVVDDARVVRRAAARMLSEEGYHVYEAASAAEALEVLATAKRPVNLVICDVVMPTTNGVELMKLIQAKWPATDALFISAYSTEVLTGEGLQTRTVDFLAKPFTRDDLMATVGSALIRQHKIRGHGRSEGV